MHAPRRLHVHTIHGAPPSSTDFTNETVNCRGGSILSVKFSLRFNIRASGSSDSLNNAEEPLANKNTPNTIYLSTYSLQKCLMACMLFCMPDHKTRESCFILLHCDFLTTGGYNQCWYSVDRWVFRAQWLLLLGTFKNGIYYILTKSFKYRYWVPSKIQKSLSDFVNNPVCVQYQIFQFSFAQISFITWLMKMPSSLMFLEKQVTTLKAL